MKVRPGPADGSSPKAKTLGMIIRPPRMEAMTARNVIQRQPLTRFEF